MQEDFYFTEKHFNLMRDSKRVIGGHDVNVVEGHEDIITIFRW